MSARIFDFLDEDRFPLSGKWKAEGTPRAFPLLMPGPVRTVPRSAQAFGARPGQPIGAAILVHQFGVVLGTTRRPVEAAQGDVELARARRCGAQPYHVTALCARGAPGLVLNWPVTTYTYHAGSANAWTASLGIEGRYPRDEVDRAGRHTAPPGSAARAALAVAAPAALAQLTRLVRDELDRAGATSSAIALVTHRQSDADRAADPGELILQILLGPALELGLVPLPDLVVSDGRSWAPTWRRALKTASAGRLPPSPPVPAPSNSPDGTGGAGGSFVP